MNGYVTTLSMDTGKCLDFEVLSKVCHGKPTQKKREYGKYCRASAVGNCIKANYTVSAPSIETEGRHKVNIPMQ